MGAISNFRAAIRVLATNEGIGEEDIELTPEQIAAQKASEQRAEGLNGTEKEKRAERTKGLGRRYNPSGRPQKPQKRGQNKKKIEDREIG